ncbi:outer membrane assembly lipoprotein YfiO [Cardinium endosymbiont of Sogatella furcifera]|uniref:outer membrane protein assembly factor BamD n=1 Tax=Cardinium endosymbiont of Sogatella furcifera TaxID=650378 RepID=UPI000E0D5CAC|nr:outer membrane protein assembly factor BamD [Cardinium endosymbiont of Sogatella furcifera]AXI23969.1 outer membrane assembly lipoprotein YfiO [Cardinium endosymbiont of Sogatella furcifera]
MKDYIINLSVIYRFRWLFLLPCTLVGPTFCVLAAAPVPIQQDFLVGQKGKIIRFYERKRYAKANEQIELLLPLLKNRLDRAKFECYQAYCNFYEKKYLVSAHQFHWLVKQYPTFQQAEEVLFMYGYSLACEEVPIALDQTFTYKAIDALEHYLAVYPAGAYCHKAAEALQSLRNRLMHKHFRAAALYVRLGYYHAAIVALKNFHETYPDTALKEQVLRLLIKCYEKLGMEAANEDKKKEILFSKSFFVQQLAQHLSDPSSHAAAGNTTF